MRQTAACLIILLFVGILIAPAQSAVCSEAGTIIRDTIRNRDGLLVIYNNWTMDTVAVLTGRWDRPGVAVYLQTEDALEIDGMN
ncbi:MAG TPA: hypothetical protein PLZ44_02955 [Methanothrix sp.]|nr:hypothetical protein [Methanothrix sp.]